MSTLKVKWSEIFFFNKAWYYLLPAFICLIASSFLGAKTPPLISSLANNYADGEKYYHTIKTLFIVFLAVYVNRSLFQLVINKYVQLLMKNVRILCYGRWLNSFELQSSQVNTRDKYPLGEVIARIMSDSESIRELITSGSFGVLIDAFFVISCLMSFIFLNTTSGIVIAFAEIMAVLVLFIGSRYMRNVFHSVRKSRGYLYRVVANVVGGVEESYYTNHHEYAKKKCEHYFDDFLKKILSSNFWDASYYSIAESMFPLFLILIAFVIPYSNVVEAGIIFAIIDLVQRSIGPIKDMAGKIANVQRALTGLNRTGQFIADLSVEQSDGAVYQSSDFSIAKMNVDISSFSYGNDRGGHFELKDIHFSISQGKLLGVIGFSGSGKSTLLNIMAGGIVPDAGKIELFSDRGEVITFPDHNRDQLIKYRLLVSSVSQDSHIFSETMAFNLSLKKVITPELENFWSLACERINYLKAWGYDLTTLCEPKSLSMGQRQLIAGLRACFLQKPVVLLDEISSGLDSQLEMALRTMVLLIQKHSLTIVVAHRLETVLEADEIIVVDDGKISAKGDHRHLLQSSEIYQDFIKELSH